MRPLPFWRWRRPPDDVGGGCCAALAGCAIWAGPPIRRSPGPIAPRLVDEWISAQARLVKRGLAWRQTFGAPNHLVDHSGALGTAGFRRAVLSSLPAQPDPTGALSAPQCMKRRRMRKAPAGIRLRLMYAALCMAGQQRTYYARERWSARTEQILADGVPYQPQSQCVDRIVARSSAAAPGFPARNMTPPPALLERHRPHDADAALLPAWRRQLRACSTAWGPTPPDLPGHHSRL